MPRLISALIAGVVLGAGLVLSGMANPQKVLAFLDLGAFAQGGWDPSLALVMAGGLLIAVPGFAYARSRGKPALAESFDLPSATAIDGRLVLGSLIFGIGWGLAGICPGPALAILSLGGQQAFIFFGAMVAGMLVFQLWSRRGA